MAKGNPGGNDRNVGSVDSSDGKRIGNFGSRPSVGQSRPYVSGSNAHGKHEKTTRGPEPGASSGHARGDGPRKGFTGR